MSTFQIYLLAPTNENIVRYINVDFAVASTLASAIDAGITHILFTYDIACRWEKNLFTRLAEYDATRHLRVDLIQSWRFAVPKFHLIGHGESCQLNYNLAFMKGAAMNHGEFVETIWSHSTTLATASRENGPHARQASLNEHWAGWNWRKVVGLREWLLTVCR